MKHMLDFNEQCKSSEREKALWDSPVRESGSKQETVTRLSLYGNIPNRFQLATHHVAVTHDSQRFCLACGIYE